jgi:hypothetical protein
MLGIWLLGGLFRRRRLPRLVGGLVAGWAIWRLCDGQQTRSLRTLLPLLILGWLALRLATGAPPDRRDPGRGDPIYRQGVVHRPWRTMYLVFIAVAGAFLPRGRGSSAHPPGG